MSKIERALWNSGPQGLTTWHREMKQWTQAPQWFHIVIVRWQAPKKIARKLSRAGSFLKILILPHTRFAWSKLQPSKKISFEYIVINEAHRIKNFNSILSSTLPLTSFIWPPPSPQTATPSMTTATTSSVYAQRSGISLVISPRPGIGFIKMLYSCTTTSFWVGLPLSIEKSLRCFEGGDIQTGRATEVRGRDEDETAWDGFSGQRWQERAQTTKMHCLGLWVVFF